jgi:hypothetical protein
MKKIVCCAVFALVLGGALFSQTWTMRNDDGDEVEWTVITKEEYNRLKRQYEASRTTCIIGYTDVIEMTGRVISGQRPKINGYFYLLRKMKNPSNDLEKAMQLVEMTRTLAYGHSARGYMSLTFANFFEYFPEGSVRVNSADYQKKLSTYTGFVEGR